MIHKNNINKQRKVGESSTWKNNAEKSKEGKSNVGVGESGNHYNFKISISKKNQSLSFFLIFDFGFGFQQLRSTIGFDQDFWHSFACCYMLPSEQLVID